MGILLIIFVVVVGIIFIMQQTENTRLAGENKRLTQELIIAQARNESLSDPLEAIAKQEPLTALKMLRSLLDRNKS